MDQVTAVKHALLRSQYVEMEERLGFPVELLQQLAETFAFDMQAVEVHVTETMKKLSDDIHAQLERDLHKCFTGGNAGGGKADSLFRTRYTAEVRRPHGVILTCLS